MVGLKIEIDRRLPQPWSDHNSQLEHHNSQVTNMPIATELFLSRVSILLLTRDIDIVIVSVRLSVCLSVTRWYCMKTA